MSHASSSEQGFPQFATCTVSHCTVHSYLPRGSWQGFFLFYHLIHFFHTIPHCKVYYSTRTVLSLIIFMIFELTSYCSCLELVRYFLGCFSLRHPEGLGTTNWNLPKMFTYYTSTACTCTLPPLSHQSHHYSTSYVTLPHPAPSCSHCSSSSRRHLASPRVFFFFLLAMCGLRNSSADGLGTSILWSADTSRSSHSINPYCTCGTLMSTCR